MCTVLLFLLFILYILLSLLLTFVTDPDLIDDLPDLSMVSNKTELKAGIKQWVLILLFGFAIALYLKIQKFVVWYRELK